MSRKASTIGSTFDWRRSDLVRAGLPVLRRIRLPDLDELVEEAQTSANAQWALLRCCVGAAPGATPVSPAELTIIVWGDQRLVALMHALRKTGQIEGFWRDGSLWLSAAEVRALFAMKADERGESVRGS